LKADNASPEKDVTDEAKKVCKSSKATVAGDASDPLDVGSDPDIHEFSSAKELKDFADCHWVVTHVTPPSWKQYLKEISLKKLCDIHDKAYMRKDVLDNMLNNKARQLISTLAKARSSCDAIQQREKEKNKAYAELEKKCNDALQDLDRNPLVLDMRIEIGPYKGKLTSFMGFKTQLLQEINGLRQDKAVVVSKVFPHMDTELVHSDEMGLLVARLFKEAMFHDRCIAFEEVAALKEPFDLEKMSGYRSSSKQEFDQAGDDLSTASYPFIVEATPDPYASVEELLLKKPKSLCTKPAPSHSKHSFSKIPVRNMKSVGHFHYIVR
ncbi:hypothetical protein Tco_1099028, partial [Tanacetum coccineum]